MRQHHCDLLQCRVVLRSGVKTLEKWRCEDCLDLTPQCKNYRNKRNRRTLPRHVRDDMKQARHARKVKYRQIKRAKIVAERRARKAALKKQRAEKRKRVRQEKMVKNQA